MSFGVVDRPSWASARLTPRSVGRNASGRRGRAWLRSRWAAIGHGQQVGRHRPNPARHSASGATGFATSWISDALRRSVPRSPDRRREGARPRTMARHRSRRWQGEPAHARRAATHAPAVGPASSQAPRRAEGQQARSSEAHPPSPHSPRHRTKIPGATRRSGARTAPCAAGAHSRRPARRPSLLSRRRRRSR
jgi:hypothetical protein